MVWLWDTLRKNIDYSSLKSFCETVQGACVFKTFSSSLIIDYYEMQLISTAFKRQTRAWKALTFSRKSFLETQQTSEKESNAISVKEHTAHTWLHSILQHLRAVDSGSLCPLTCKPQKPQPALAEKHWTVQFFWASPHLPASHKLTPSSWEQI